MKEKNHDKFANLGAEIRRVNARYHHVRPKPKPKPVECTHCGTRVPTCNGVVITASCDKCGGSLCVDCDSWIRRRRRGEP